MISIVIPVYRNAANIAPLLEALGVLHVEMARSFEVVFVVDGSPDRSYALLREALPRQPFQSKLLLLSRNFGSFAAIRAGLAHASGDYLAMMAADLQEPPALIKQLCDTLAMGDCDVVLGTREGREDPLLARLASTVFWWLYRRLVQRRMPPGGMDVFACTRAFADRLLQMREANSSLVGLVIWMGYRSKTIAYRRQARQHGKSAWTFARKWRYFQDSIFAFTDLPFRLLSTMGAVAVAGSLLLSTLAIISRVSGRTPVPGYTITVILIMFFGGINSIGLSVLGGYLWRAFENTKARPNYLVAVADSYAPAAAAKGSDGPIT